jgi:tetratricopeptide (TPR) repeat protein
MTALDPEFRSPRHALGVINGLRGAEQEREHELLLRALERWPRNLSLGLRMAESYCDRQDHALAIIWLDEICANHPHAVRPRIMVADLYCQVGSPRLAITYLEQALRLRPNSLAVLRRLAGTLYYQERLEEAEPHYVRWIELAPHSPRALFDLAHIYARTGRAARAELTLRQVLAVAPRHGETIAELATIYMMEQRHSEAEALLREALADDNRIVYMRLLGGLLTDIGRYAEAEPMLRQVLEREPANAFALLKLARLCAATQREEEAKTLALRSLDPTRLQAADLLHALIIPALTDGVMAELAKGAPGEMQERPPASLLKGLLFPQTTAGTPPANENPTQQPSRLH